ncbi:MAG: hypothetical protein ACFE0Q_04430 [Anaerolineae bacterium]
MSQYVAVPFEAASPDVMVIGQTMQAFIENVQADVIKPILEKHEITEINAEAWYPHQLWMDILQDIDETLGGNAQMAFVAFGRKVVEKAAMPLEINSIPAALNLLHTIHHMNLQNAPEDEGFIIEQISDKHYHVYENTPNPSDAMYGFIWGICARFRDGDEGFTVEIIANPKAESQPGTLFDVQWGM